MANSFSSGSYHSSNHIDRYCKLVQSRCVAWKLFPRFGYCFFHYTKYVHSSFFCLLKRLFHYFERNPFNFNIHLESRNAFGGTADLKIHITKVVFIAEYIGKHHNFIFLFNKSHCNPCNRAFYFNAAVHKRKRTGANGCHWWWTVGFKYIRYKPYSIRKITVQRKHIFKRTFCKVPVPYFSSSGTGYPSGFTDRKRREVVMEHKRLCRFRQKPVYNLLVHLCTER